MKSKCDWVVFVFGENEYPIQCYRCGGKLHLPLPQPVAVFVAAAKAFARLHKDCPPKSQ